MLDHTPVPDYNYDPNSNSNSEHNQEYLEAEDQELFNDESHILAFDN